MIEIELTVFICAILSFFIGSVIKGTIGFGLPVITTPVLIFFLPLPEVIALQILSVFVGNIQQCWSTRSQAAILKQFWPMVLANIIILLLGSRLLVQLDITILMPIIGFLVILQAVFADAPIFKLKAQTNVKPLILLSGIASGTLGSVSSFFVFPSVQLIYSMHLKREEFVFIVGFLLGSGYIALWVGIAANGFFVYDKLFLSIILIIPTIIGMWMGNDIRKRFSGNWFKNLVRGMLILTGITLIGKSLIF